MNLTSFYQTVDHDSILISGDFNICVDNNTDRYANHFIYLLSSWIPAWASHNQGHILDLIISKGIDKCTLDVGISDHFCLFVCLFFMDALFAGLSKQMLNKPICDHHSYFNFSSWLPVKQIINNNKRKPLLFLNLWLVKLLPLLFIRWIHTEWILIVLI